MHTLPDSAFVNRFGLPGLLLLLTVVSVTAQEASENNENTAAVSTDAAAEPAGDVDEFLVVGKRPDEEARAEQLYSDMLREQMFDEIERMRQEEEIAWRESNLNITVGEEQRFTFGYDPVTERDLRNQTDINEMPGENVKPATLFRARF